MKRNVRRVRPIQKARGKPMMLSQRQPVPDRALAGRSFPIRVLFEIPQQVRLCFGGPAQFNQARFQLRRVSGSTTENKIRTISSEALLPGIHEHFFLEINPVSNSVTFHSTPRSNRTFAPRISLFTFHFYLYVCPTRFQPALATEWGEIDDREFIGFALILNSERLSLDVEVNETNQIGVK